MVEEKTLQAIEADIAAKKFDVAIPKLQAILKNEPDNVAVLLDIGYAYGSVNRFSDAIAVYEKVIAKVPDNEAGYTGLGFIYKKQGEFEKAVTQFNKALEFRVDNPMVYFELGEAYFELEKYDEAIKVLHKAIQFGGSENDAQTLLLIAQAQLGKETEEGVKEAIRLAQKVLELDHNYIGAHLVLGTAYFVQKDWKTALDNLEIYIQSEPDNEAALNLIKEAKEHLQK
jgi:tetratricopeptide (TPR) repeat protein